MRRNGLPLWMVTCVTGNYVLWSTTPPLLRALQWLPAYFSHNTPTDVQSRRYSCTQAHPTYEQQPWYSYV